MVAPFKKYKFSDFVASDLVLTPVELKDYIDFEVKRIYYVKNIAKKTGTHCHYKEDELFILLQGSLTAVIDQGGGIEEIPMNPSEGIFVGHYVWHGFINPSSDALLLAISSTNYNSDRSDYLEDYDEYLKIRDEKLSKYQK